MKISIITPCFNAEKYIEDTMNSIVNQSKNLPKGCSIEHIICDGNSTDNTISIIERIYEQCDSPLYEQKVISESDSGMYDALAKGLNESTGDVVGYLNAGDIYDEKGLLAVIEAFNNEEYRWITGQKTLINEENTIIKNNTPYIYRKSLILSGVYGAKRILKFKLPYIQQESTFWRKELNSYIDIKKLSEFKLAGDYYIWFCFANENIQLININKRIGKFKVHAGQLSSNLTEYENEVKELSLKVSYWNVFMFLVDLPFWIIFYVINHLKYLYQEKAF